MRSALERNECTEWGNRRGNSDCNAHSDADPNTNPYADSHSYANPNTQPHAHTFADTW